MSDSFNKKAFQQIPAPGAGRHGFSIVEVIIGVALIGIAAVGITRGLGLTRRVQDDAVLRQGALKFQDSLRAALAERVSGFIADGCSGLRYGVKPTASVSGGAFTKINSTVNSGTPLIGSAFSTIALGSSDAVGGSLNFTTSPKNVAAQFSAAAQRCASPHPTAVGDANGKIGSSGEFLYFCMDFALDSAKASENKDSFWSMKGAFIEVLMTPVDLASDAPIKCADVVGSRQGVKVAYSIYGSYDPNRNTATTGQTSALKGIRYNGLYFISGSSIASARVDVPDKWYPVDGAVCGTYCTSLGLTNKFSPDIPAEWNAGPPITGPTWWNQSLPLGAACASGENRPPSFGGPYPYGTWGGGNYRQASQSNGGNCYGWDWGPDRLGAWQIDDQDPTDKTVACYCGSKFTIDVMTQME